MSEAIILEGASGGRDENLISTFTVPYYVETLSEVTTVGSEDYQGLQESGRSWTAWNATQGYVVTVTYKGHLKDDDKPKEPKETEQWSLDFDVSEEPLESHPDLKEIKTIYGGFKNADKELEFPETLPSGAAGKSGLGGKKLKAGDVNPLHGATTYAVMTARVKRSWSAKKIPKTVVNDIGKIYRNIPDAPSSISDVDFGNRTWMALPPKISQNGNVWRIENEWLLSPPAGWNETIYKPASKQ